MPSIKKKQTGATLPLTVSELSLHSKGTNYDVISVQEPIILTSFGNQTGSGRHRLGSEAPVQKPLRLYRYLQYLMKKALFSLLKNSRKVLVYTVKIVVYSSGLPR